MIYLQSFLRKGVSLGHVGRNLNPKDLKDLRATKGFLRKPLVENRESMEMQTKSFDDRQWYTIKGYPLMKFHLWNADQ